MTFEPRRLNRVVLEDLAAELGVEAVFLERDWVLTGLIHALATGPLSEQLVLKGGQALRHVHGSERLSKDADYVARRRVEFDDLRTALQIRQPRISVPEAPEGRTGHGFRVRPIAYRGLLGIPGTVEVEVSFRQDLVLAPRIAAFHSPFREPFPILVMDIQEMVCEKLRALYQRGNPRDLYDLWFITKQPSITLDPDTIVQLLPEKFRPPLVRGGWDRARLYERMEGNAGAWRETLKAVAPNHPDYDEALRSVQRALRFLPR